MKKTAVIVLAAFAALALAGARAEDTASADYPAAARAINALMRAHHYNPAELAAPAYAKIEAGAIALGETAQSDEEFIGGYNALWKDGPFSHVRLAKAQGTADELAAYLDGLRIGGGGATLEWADETAVLTVNTMMGLDTIEEIDTAYDEVAERGADKLIIDLRENGGGAFAVLPLVSHVLAAPYEAGVFVARAWNAEHDAPPTRKDALGVEPWEGWSIVAFWRDVQTNMLTRIRFSPTEPVFAGPVYVLTSAKTASAAEMAADALQGSGRATIIGEQTAGKMLSQKMFDVPGGFHLSLPIADYYSLAAGRIEGAGVRPDIPAPAADAMDIAKAQ